MAEPISFRCPLSGMNFQVYVTRRPPLDGPSRGEAVFCIGCGEIHFLDTSTGELLVDGGGDLPGLPPLGGGSL